MVHTGYVRGVENPSLKGALKALAKRRARLWEENLHFREGFVMPDLVPGMGELVICHLCDSSAHLHGCPFHSDFENESIVYARTDDPDDGGPAAFWVRDTFGQAAKDAGATEVEATQEGIEEFHAALSSGMLRRLQTP